MPNTKHNHHYVPRAYLRGFADPSEPSHIWVYARGKSFDPGSKGHHNPRRTSLKKAGATRDFYAWRLDLVIWILIRMRISSRTSKARPTLY